jgi:hypothetical protein
MQNDKDALASFGQCSVQVARLLKESLPLTQGEYLSIENALLVMQLALASSRLAAKKRAPRHA